MLFAASRNGILPSGELSLRCNKADAAMRNAETGMRECRPVAAAAPGGTHRAASDNPAVSAFAFSTHAGFAAAPVATGEPFAIAGIGFDGATTNRPGARFGPRAIRQASLMLCDATHPLWDTTPLGHLGDAGDLTLPNTALAALREALVPQATALLARHHMVWLGGDHSITLPLLQAHRQAQGRPLAVVHFDAHCDTWDSHFSEPSGHGTWVREAFEQGLVVEGCFTQIGIRSAAEREPREYVERHGGRTFTARDLRGLESAAQLAPVLASIHERQARHGHPPLYLSLDIDCLDPAFAPGTGTPEPGGLSTAQVLSLLESLSADARLNFIGMDCCEVAPPFDHAELTSQAAAYCVWTYLCGRLAAAR
jgi:agmatinase